MSGVAMLGSVILLILTGMMFKFLKGNYEIFINIHKFLFITMCVGVYFHKAYYVYYIGVSAVAFDLFIRLVFMLINRKTLSNT